MLAQLVHLSRRDTQTLGSRPIRFGVIEWSARRMFSKNMCLLQQRVRNQIDNQVRINIINEFLSRDILLTCNEYVSISA